MKNAVKFRIVIVSLAGLAGIASISAHAEQLSEQDCHSYPFVQTVSPTHQQIGHEMMLLEHDGYNPIASDFYYPDNMQVAEKKLQNDYARDCLHIKGQQSM